MSGSSNALLDSLAHPAQINLLADYGGAAQTANAIWQNRLWQARQAAGQAQQGGIDASGVFQPSQANQLLAATGAAGALAVPDTLESTQRLGTAQTSQAVTTNRTLADALAPLINPQLTPDNALHGAVGSVGAQLIAAGMDPQRVTTALARLPNDPALLRPALERLRQSVLPPEQQQQAIYGTPGTATGPGGVQIGTMQSPTTGALSAPPQPGVQTGPDAGTLYGVSTITNPDGSATTDTLAGHQKAGRVSSLGEINPGYAAATASPAMVTALRGQEGTPNGQTSAAGARGQMQVTPAFFKQYAQPGESFDSKRDVEAVAQRGIAALEAQYPNDPGRVATAYFSGQGNVAPAGSPTPYKADVKDANGTPTSAYVAGAVQRYNAARPPATGTPTSTPQPPAGPQTGGTTVQPSTLAQNKIDQDQYNERVAGYNNSDANLAANLKEAYALGQKIATGRGLAGLSDIRSGIVSLGRAVGVNTGSFDTNDQARAELDKVLNQILISNPGAGRSDASLGTAGAATPHLGMNTNAMLNQVRILYGQIKQQNAAMLEHDPASNGVGYQAHNRTMMSSTARDGFAADLMTPEEIDARVKSLGTDTPAAKAFKAAVVKNIAIYHAAPGSGLGS